jgi:integrase
MGVDEHGKSIRKAFYGKTRAEVSAKLSDALSAQNKGALAIPSRMKLSEWMDTWITDYKAFSVKSSTATIYSSLIENHLKPALGDTLLQGLKSEMIQKAIVGMSEKGLSPNSVKVAHAMLRACLEQAMRNGLIFVNPAKGITLPRREKVEARAFTIEEQEKFIKEAKTRSNGLLFIFGIGTGLRIGEILGLRWDDVDLSAESLRVRRTYSVSRTIGKVRKWKREFTSPKSISSIRSVPLLPELAKRLRQVKEDSDGGELVFCTKNKTPYDQRNMQRVFHSICKRAGLEGFHIHSLRHTFATRSLERGMELKVAQEILGHSSIKMTADMYMHVMPEKKRESMMKLSGMLGDLEI